MTKKIFQSILLVAGCVLLASLLIIMGFLYDYFGGVEENQLRDELSLAAAAVEDGGTDYLSQLTADRCRLTWIAADGSVLYDTKTNAESLENHASRAEVSQALATGTGESTRYSSTLMEKTMYYAQRLDDGTVLRISISRATVGMIAVGMIQPLLIVLIVALILSGLLARRLSRRIVDPLNSLDLEHPLDNDAYEELSPLLKRIHHQHVEIQTQLRELREKTDEFTQITGSMREGLVLLDEHGSILPKVFGGFGTTVRIANFDVSATFDYQLGGKVFDGYYQSVITPAEDSGSAGQNIHKDWVRSWSVNNTSSDMPRWQYGDAYGGASSDRFLTNASYLNFQSFTVGYTLPMKTFNNKLKMRIYVAGENLCYWSARKGLDPRYSYSGNSSVIPYSPIRTISGGIQLTF